MLGRTRLDFIPEDQGAAEATRKRWRRLQQLNAEFWRRWIREYLPTLQGRQKWTEPAGNLREGELVLLVEQNARMALEIASLGLVLESGELILQGSGEELLRSAEVRAAYLGEE